MEHEGFKLNPRAIPQYLSLVTCPMTDANQSWVLLCNELEVLVDNPPEIHSLDLRTKWVLEIEEKMVSRGALFLCDRYIQHIGQVSKAQS